VIGIRIQWDLDFFSGSRTGNLVSIWILFRTRISSLRFLNLDQSLEPDFEGWIRIRTKNHPDPQYCYLMNIQTYVVLCFGLYTWRTTRIKVNCTVDEHKYRTLLEKAIPIISTLAENVCPLLMVKLGNSFLRWNYFIVCSICKRSLWV
jgi:hypothetical protein